MSATNNNNQSRPGPTDVDNESLPLLEEYRNDDDEGRGESDTGKNNNSGDETDTTPDAGSSEATEEARLGIVYNILLVINALIFFAR